MAVSAVNLNDASLWQMTARRLKNWSGGISR